MKIASLHLHPVKGCRAVDVVRALAGPRGLAGDRLWMLVDAGGLFLSQRSHPQLATVDATLLTNGLRLTLPGSAAFSVADPAPAGACVPVTVWSSPLDALVAPDWANARLSTFLGEPVRLVRMPADAARMANPDWAGPTTPVSFADAHPVLIATTGSLAALNEAIAAAGGDPVPMARFRPNIVIDAPAWAEDRWRRIRIGSVEIELVKPSDRCLVTTTDQETGQRRGKEPLATLARLRRSADARINGVLFGENAAVRAEGTIAVGDSVAVLETRSAWPLEQ